MHSGHALSALLLDPLATDLKVTVKKRLSATLGDLASAFTPAAKDTRYCATQDLMQQY